MKNIIKILMVPNTFSVEQKQCIDNDISLITLADAYDDFLKLQIKGGTNIGKSNIGCRCVDYFTRIERLDTKCTKGYSFYDMLNNKSLFCCPSILSFFRNSYKVEPSGADTKYWWRFFNMCGGSISSFNPQIAMDIYKIFKPTCVLDFCSGWGGRLIGTYALNIPKYIGIDINHNLVEPYEKMKSTFSPFVITETLMFCDDAVQFNYSAHTYDMVFTSPPYYNIEIYNGTTPRTKKEWNTAFYNPVFIASYNGLTMGGKFCLNINTEIFHTVAFPLLGEPNFKFALQKNNRNPDKEYKEYIYVWIKDGIL